MTAASDMGLHRRAGFTLIEVLGAILLTSIVVATSLGIYWNVQKSSTRAVEVMREGLTATVILDRIARDLTGATLLTREEDKDPLSHPWFFTATSAHTFDGSDHLKFTSRSQQPKVSYYHRSDLAEIAYFTEIEEDETVTLYRWLSPSLPLGYVPDFPSSDDERSFILAENLREFSMRFRTADGEWTDSWDSTQLEVSGQLPTAVEIAVALFDEELLDDPGLAFDDAADPDAGRFVRHVVIPQPPLDLLGMIQAKIEGEAELVANNQNNNNDDDDDSDGSGMSVGQCVSANLQACSDNPALGPDECNYLATLGSVPVADYPGVIPPEWGCI